MAEYSFYIQRYKESPTAQQESAVDVESQFDCKYCSFSGLLDNGEVKNAYTEDYAERSKLRCYLPNPQDIAYSPTQCVLTLLFKSEDCISKSAQFADYVAGRLIEWHDTFRGRYVTLLMTAKPETQQEKLYGGQKYRQVKYTFTNICGQSFASTQITN